MTGRRNAQLAGGKRRGRQARDAAGLLGGALGQLGTRHRPVHHAKLARSGAIKYFGAENKPGGERGTTNPRETLSTACTGNQSKPNFRQPEFGFGRRDTQIARQCQLKSPAHRRATDLGQRDLGQPLDPRIEPLDASHVRIHSVGTVGCVHARAYFFKIGARAEHLLVRADMQNGKPRAATQFVKFCFECLHPFFADRIHRRVAQRQGGHGIAGVGQEHNEVRFSCSAWATSARLMTSRWISLVPS